ncbi:MAG: 2Fe-2S iron-sulfur cluster-binding protein [Bacteroidota bacterium]
MGILGNIFKKKEKKAKKAKHHTAKGFVEIKVSGITKLTDTCVQLSFDIPVDLKEKFKFKPGQYINISVEIDGIDERRSYSICSGSNEHLAIAVKEVENGLISKWVNNDLEVDDFILISPPQGNFVLDDSAKNVVSFGAGSGITPILAIAKSIEENAGKMKLFYANRTEKDIIFKNELASLKNTETTHFLTKELNDNHKEGRLTKEKISEIIKNDLNLLKADGFFICGPEEMIFGAKEILGVFGVPKEKIHFELFTTPTEELNDEVKIEENTFKGLSKVKVILDDEVTNFTLKTDGKTILDAVTSEGYDAPYSCRGGVCCTCKAKVLSGSASMKLNYSLTDLELKNGYILTCQAHPTSEELTISYDE